MLARTGSALLSGDFGIFAECFLLPQEIDTFRGRDLIDSVDKVRERFDGVRDFMQKNGVTEMARHCIEAHFKDGNTIESTHETRMASGSTLVQAPFVVFSILRRTEGRWQIAYTSYAINDCEALERVLAGDRGPEVA